MPVSLKINVIGTVTALILVNPEHDRSPEI
jgi:hypothetical protein